MEYEQKNQPEYLEQFMARHGITIESVFVPWSRSRNRNEDRKTLNWQCDLMHNDRVIITGVEYSAGVGHIPGYKMQSKDSRTRPFHDHESAICETGNHYQPNRGHGETIKCTAKTWRGQIMPKPHDVLVSLVMDSDVLMYCGFTDWCDNLGYDSDSIKAKATFDACMETALQLRNGLGIQLFDELQTACEDM
jgi:hypothetical protein